MFIAVDMWIHIAGSCRILGLVPSGLPAAALDLAGVAEQGSRFHLGAARRNLAYPWLVCVLGDIGNWPFFVSNDAFWNCGLPQTGRRFVRPTDSPLSFHVCKQEVVVGVQVDVLPCVHHVHFAQRVEDETCVERSRHSLRVAFVVLEVPGVGLTRRQSTHRQIVKQTVRVHDELLRMCRYDVGEVLDNCVPILDCPVLF